LQQVTRHIAEQIPQPASAGWRSVRLGQTAHLEHGG
jgi:hypothetical protein